MKRKEKIKANSDMEINLKGPLKLAIDGEWVECKHSGLECPNCEKIMSCMAMNFSGRLTNPDAPWIPAYGFCCHCNKVYNLKGKD